MSEDNGTKLLAVLGSMALGAAACATILAENKRKKSIIENFGMQQRTVRAVPTVSSSVSAAQMGQMVAATPQMQQAAVIQARGMLPAAITAAGTFQSAPPPRMFAGQIPSSVSLDLPSSQNMAFTANSPFATPPGAVNTMMTYEGFDGAGPSMNRENPSILPTSALSGGTAAISGSSGSGSGGMAANAGDQPVMFDRNIFANIIGRNFGQGDPIRGDLPIAPNKSGWFQVSANPAIDLQTGALAVMGGTFNEQGQNIASLVNMSSGGTKTAISGVNMASSMNTCLAGAGQDVTAIAFA